MEDLSIVFWIDTSESFWNVALLLYFSLNDLLCLFIGKSCLGFDDSSIISDSGKYVALNVDIEPYGKCESFKSWI